MSEAPKESAARIVWGIALLVVGQVIYSAGQQAALEATLNGYRDDGSSQIAVGGVLALVGLVCLMSGLVRLAGSVDYLARREHAREVIASTSTDGDDGGAA